MKIRDLLSGIASGYLTKAIQLVISLALVPFLLRDDVLGLEDFGRASAILAAVQLLTLCTDGMRLSFTRAVAQAVGQPGGAASPGAALGSGSKVLALTCAALAGAIGLAAGPVLRFLSIDASPDNVRALWLTAALFFAENSFNLLQVPLMTRGAISYVNYCLTAETLLRAGGLWLALTLRPHSLSLYFAVFLAAALARHAVFALRLLRSSPQDLRGAARARIAVALPALRYSMPLTAHWGTTILIQRAPIVIASQFLGAEASGLIAIAITTIRGYFLQILFSVLQPIELPVGSLLDPRKLSAAARATLWDLEGIYVLSVTGLIACASSVAPELLRLWLGPGYAALALPSQIVLLGCGVELSLSLRRSIVTGQGLLGASVHRYAIAGALTLVACLVSAIWLERWEPMVASVGIFLVLANSWAIAAPFRRAFGALAGPHWLRIPLFATAASAIALGLSALFGSDASYSGLLALPATALLVALLAQFALIPLDRALATLRRLRALGDRSLLAPDAAPPDTRKGSCPAQ